MSASQFASFAAYTPPPDEFDLGTVSSLKPTTIRSAWFPSENSYQSGGVPASYNVAFDEEGPEREEAPQNKWETRCGWRVDILAAGAYILGPVSALALLILETQNDYVRFHAYQSALLTTPLVFFRIILSIAQFPSWIRTFCTLVTIMIQLCTSFYAYYGASQNHLVHQRAPFIGQIADKWLVEE
ncbi:hypothetical protein GALMADRAFT_233553 [Galerina marginata CBS 339.88]|uniref:Uncharacterized protein n=1 Tax=Galerina marginata (strain CBS 339.88) TaxID=685588 RepID=A0A067U0Z2_GALM3|nr:hypothetical protein GALMADRAFT_233553 [Galerina marginata CBS 339.88]